MNDMLYAETGKSTCVFKTREKMMVEILREIHGEGSPRASN